MTPGDGVGSPAVDTVTEERSRDGGAASRSCCGAPRGCTARHQGCAYLAHPWKRAMLFGEDADRCRESLVGGDFEEEAAMDGGLLPRHL